MSLYTYEATVLKWLDGDSLEVAIDLGFKLALKQTVRVFGINCPETRSIDPQEKIAGNAAKLFASQLIPVGDTVRIRSYKPDAGDKFGRWLATIQLPEGNDFAAEMIKAKHARVYAGGKRPPWTPIVDEIPSPQPGG